MDAELKPEGRIAIAIIKGFFRALPMLLLIFFLGALCFTAVQCARLVTRSLLSSGTTYSAPAPSVVEQASIPPRPIQLNKPQVNDPMSITGSGAKQATALENVRADNSAAQKPLRLARLADEIGPAAGLVDAPLGEGSWSAKTYIPAGYSLLFDVEKWDHLIVRNDDAQPRAWVRSPGGGWIPGDAVNGSEFLGQFVQFQSPALHPVTVKYWIVKSIPPRRTGLRNPTVSSQVAEKALVKQVESYPPPRETVVPQPAPVQPSRHVDVSVGGDVHKSSGGDAGTVPKKEGKGPDKGKPSDPPKTKKPNEPSHKGHEPGATPHESAPKEHPAQPKPAEPPQQKVAPREQGKQGNHGPDDKGKDKEKDKAKSRH
jgi:hypothetical protein